MTISQYLRKNAIYYPDAEALKEACIKQLGCERKGVSVQLWKIQRSKSPITIGGGQVPAKPCNGKIVGGLSESQIRAKHDTRFIMEELVNNLEKGIFIPDQDLIRQCDIKSHIGFRQVLDHERFKRYKGKAGGITYWSHPDSIKEMKDEGILT